MRVKIALTIALIIALALLLAVDVLVRPQTAVPPQTISTTSTAHIVITSVDGQWKGQTYALISSSYDSANYSPQPVLGATITWGFTNNGQGFSPTKTFSITPLTQGFNILWVTYCIKSPSTSPGFRNTTSIIYFPGYSAFSQTPTAQQEPGCAEFGNNVDMNNVPPNSSIYVFMGVQFPSTSYDGPLEMLISEG